ncbi:Thiamine transporter ThiT [Listeria fleischmannii FSL S10-1203]|uniref:Thiamine transporter ThiT n=1 Tax=Listeria fleischmannii FSL S10-1203 TaxID=1265822 RepID=W7DYZ9_9LIST|nr:Thiamine transporter ThiT [Listeria fleischmannii FSL S10-1203]
MHFSLGKLLSSAVRVCPKEEGSLFFMSNKRLIVLLECAIFAAIAMVLSFIPLDIGSSFSISLGMIPMYVIAIRRGFFAAGIFWFTLGAAPFFNW